MNSQDYTICITNFSRPERLRRSLESVKHLPNVVVASYGADVDLHQSIIDEIRPGTRCYLTPNDYGCNRLWLQTVVLAQTQWVVILHDDDLLNPEFEEVLSSVDTTGAEFIAWDGLCKWDDGSGRPTSAFYPWGDTGTGLYSSLPLVSWVTTPHGGMVASPVTMMLKKDIVMSVLSWCETGIADCVTRPTMMIGNEIALLFGHLKSYSKWFHIARPLVTCGAGPESETVKWMAGTNPELVNLYDKVRDRFGKEQFIFRKDNILPIFIQVHTTGGFNDRQKLAKETLTAEFRTIEKNMLIVPLLVTDKDFSRTSGSFGDVRNLPFIHDILDKAYSFSYSDNDIIMMVNDDICFIDGSLKKMIEKTKSVGSTYAHRRDIHGNMFNTLGLSSLTRSLTKEEIKIGHRQDGTDTIFMTRNWWYNIGRESLPDFVIGCEAWDTIMIMIMRLSRSGWGFRNTTYHQYHGGWWEQQNNRFTNIGQIHNRRHAKAILIAYGLYKGEFEDGVAADPAHPINAPGCDDDDISDKLSNYIGRQNHSQDNVHWHTP